MCWQPRRQSPRCLRPEFFRGARSWAGPSPARTANLAFVAARSGPSAKYWQRAEMFVKAIDIAGELQADTELARFDGMVKEMVLGQRRPGNVTGTMTLAGLRSLEHAFFTRFNEGSGPEVDEFWRRVAASGLPYTRKDVLGDILARGHIRSDAEFEVAVDSVVVAQQEGRIDEDQAAKLSVIIGRYEQRQARR
jgi:hypothetical protein